MGSNNVNEEYVKDRCYFLEKNTGKENDRQGKVKYGYQRGWRKAKRTGKKKENKVLAFHL